MENNSIDNIGILVDRSKSMETMGEEVVAGVNCFVSEQKQRGANARISILEFDHEVSQLYSGDLFNCPVFDGSHFIPRGTTALHDGIHRLIDKMQEHSASKNIAVILTDGAENSSKLHDVDSTRSRIEELKSQGWSFVFLAANQDAFTAGATMGISACIEYEANPESQFAALRAASDSVTRTRSTPQFTPN
jgi:uncharacterized protein YegL